MNSSMLPWKSLSASLQLGALTEGWNLADPPPEASEEARVFHFPVFFASPFATPPVVHLALTGFDIDQRDSCRLNVCAVDVSPIGFTAEISTWRDSRVYSVSLGWLALGA